MMSQEKQWLLKRGHPETEEKMDREKIGEGMYPIRDLRDFTYNVNKQII